MSLDRKPRSWSSGPIAHGLALVAGTILGAACAHDKTPPASEWPTGGPASARPADDAWPAAPGAMTMAEGETPGPAGRAPAQDAGTSTCSAFAAPGVLKRQAVVRTIDGGMGRWLQGIAVAPERAGARFAGWKILGLPSSDPCYRSVDLRVGDVVTRVNGSALERPDDALTVFQNLRSAPALDIDLRRTNEARHIQLRIRD